MEATMSATEADVYAKMHLLLVNGVCFDDSMSGAGVQGDGAGVQGEEDESDGEENGLCHGLRHVPPNLRRAVLVALWSFLLRTQKDNKALMGQLFAELCDDSENEAEGDPELREMVLQALDVLSVGVLVGHHEEAKRGKQAGEPFRMEVLTGQLFPV